MKRIILTSVLLGVVLVLAACSAVGIGGIGDSPEGAANEWLQALAAGDGLKLDDRTCAEQVDALQDGSLLQNLFGPVGETVRSDKAKVDISALQVSQVALNGDAAKVKVTGRIRAGEGLAVKSQVIDQSWQMAREQNKWRFCGLTLLTAEDLQRIVLQPSDIHGSLAYSSEDVGQFFNGEFSSLRTSAAPQSLVARDYRVDGSQGSYSSYGSLLSITLLFQSPIQASQELAEMKNNILPASSSLHQDYVIVSEFPIPSGLAVDGVMTITSPGGVAATGTFEQFRAGIIASDGSQFLWSGNKRQGTIVVRQKQSVLGSPGAQEIVPLAVDGLGDEGFGLTDPGHTFYFYSWRNNNVLMSLYINICQQSISEETVRAYVDKMQAHVASNRAPEPLPTPLAANIEIGCPAQPTAVPPTAAPVTTSP